MATVCLPPSVDDVMPKLTAGIVQKNFVQVMRAVECMLGISVPGYKSFETSPNSNVTFTMSQAALTITIPEVQKAINQAVPILLQIALELKIDVILDPAVFWAGGMKRTQADPLTSKYALLFMDCIRD